MGHGGKLQRNAAQAKFDVMYGGVLRRMERHRRLPLSGSELQDLQDDVFRLADFGERVRTLDSNQRRNVQAWRDNLGGPAAAEAVLADLKSVTQSAVRRLQTSQSGADIGAGVLGSTDALDDYSAINRVMRRATDFLEPGALRFRAQQAQLVAEMTYLLETQQIWNVNQRRVHKLRGLLTAVRGADMPKVTQTLEPREPKWVIQGGLPGLGKR